LGSDLLVLGFDTSAAHCAAALLSGDTLLDVRSENMSRGQAERLMPLIEEMLTSNGFGWTDLDRIGVGVGPGNFSGIRISVAAARGLALSLGVPAIGITTFSATMLDMTEVGTPAVLAPQNRVYLAPVGQDPFLMQLAEAEVSFGPLVLPPEREALVASIARIASLASPPFSRPTPLYIRPADAAPARTAPPVILKDDA
jgi:tRNA threonylcarbamoyl adenosine modification protein YeaZ